MPIMSELHQSGFETMISEHLFTTHSSGQRAYHLAMTHPS